MLMIFTDDPNSFWLKAVAPFLLINGLCLLFSFDLPRVRFKKMNVFSILSIT